MFEVVLVDMPKSPQYEIFKQSRSVFLMTVFLLVSETGCFFINQHIPLHAEVPADLVELPN